MHNQPDGSKLEHLGQLKKLTDLSLPGLAAGWGSIDLMNCTDN
jgi:hypothetical protein